MWRDGGWCTDSCNFVPAVMDSLLLASQLQQLGLFNTEAVQLRDYSAHRDCYLPVGLVPLEALGSLLDDLWLDERRSHGELPSSSNTSVRIKVQAPLR